MEKGHKFLDLIDIETIQSIQDNCSKAIGLAFVTVDYRGKPITRFSGFTEHCRLGRETPGFAERCFQCDAHGGLHAAITGQPYIYRCHADLVDFAVPLILKGSYVGAVLGGQVRLSEEEEKELDHIIPQRSGKKNSAVEEAYRNAQTVTYAKLESAVTVLRDMILYMLEENYKSNLTQELEGKNQELEEEKVVRSNLEGTIQEQEITAIQQKEGFRYFFFVMNLIARLAYQEKAAQTEAVAYDFSDMMRYLSDSEHKFTTLGEELSYIGCLLRVQKAWLRERLTYSISVPEHYWDTPCPFMTLQPIVENALVGMAEAGEGSRKISIFVEESDSDIVLEVSSNSKRMTLGDVESLLRVSDTADHFSLYNANRRLKGAFGNEYCLSAKERTDGEEGLTMYLKLPRNR